MGDFIDIFCALLALLKPVETKVMSAMTMDFWCSDFQKFAIGGVESEQGDY